MADLKRLEEALRNADAAGDTAAASALAAEIRRAQSSQPEPPPQGGGIRGLIRGDVPQPQPAPEQATPGWKESLKVAVRGVFPASELLTNNGAYMGRGGSDSALETIGAPVDLVARGANYASKQLGGDQIISRPFGGSEMLKGIRDRAVGSMPDPQTTDEKFAYGAGRGIGDAASIALPASAVAQITKPMSVAGGVSRALASSPVMQMASGAIGGGVGEATDNPLLGMAAAFAVPVATAAFSKALSPNMVKLGDMEKQIVANAKKEGIPLNIGQETGNKTVNAVNSVLRKLPFSGDLANNADDATRAAFNRAVLKRAGVDATKATPEVLDDAFTLAGKSFDDLIARTPEIQLGKQFFDKVDDVAASYGRRLPSNVANVFTGFVDDLNTARAAAAQPGSRALIDSATYKRIYSDMARVMRTSQDRELVSAVGQLKGALDEAMTSAVPKELAGEWKSVRQAYSTLTAIAQAMAKGGQAADKTGNIPFGAFRNEVRNADPRGFARGRGQLNELARIGSYLADTMPDSGTAQRTLIGNIVTGGSVGGGAGAMLGNPILGAAAGLAGPPAAYGLLNNPATRWWMTNQLASGVAPNSEVYGGVLSGRLLDQLKQFSEQSATR